MHTQARSHGARQSMCRRLAVSLAALAFGAALTACTTTGKQPGVEASDGTFPGSPPTATAPAAPPTEPAPHLQGASDAIDFLVLRRTGLPGYEVVVGSDGQPAFTLPDGVPSRDWTSLYTVTPDGPDSTVVTAIAPEGGGTDRTIHLPGSWELPRIGTAQVPAGLSVDGRTLVLVEPAAVRAPHPGRTRFAVIATDGSAAPKVITITGAFTFDALSPEGASAYVIEHAGTGPEYSVRRLDLASGTLVSGAIVDKREADEAMAGQPITQVVGPDGWAYTLYLGPNGAFVHALDTPDGVAFCIDLPGTDTATVNAMARWGLALAGQTLYVTDGASGRIREVDLASFSVSRTAAAGTISLAKFESGTWSPGGHAALSPDLSTLFIAAASGIEQVRTRDLSATGTLGSGSFESVAASASGLVYGVDTNGALWRLDPGGVAAPFRIATSGFTGISALVSVR